MVASMVITCTWCHMNGKEGIPAKPEALSHNGEGGLFDLCEECRERIVVPLEKMRAAKLVRANRPGDLPIGVVVTTPPVAGRHPNAAGDDFLCADSSCDWEGGSYDGLLYHLNHEHPELPSLTAMQDQVTVCGLCLEPCRSASALGIHAKRVHLQEFQRALRKGYAWALISATRRAGDPHGALRAMDALILTARSGKGRKP